MSCTDIKLKGYNKLDAYLANQVGRGSNEYLQLASLISTSEFNKIIEERNINPKTSPKQTYEVLLELKANTTKSIKDINRVTNKETDGLFSSRAAKIAAIDYASSIINNTYFDDIFKGKNDIKTLQQLVSLTKQRILKTIYNNLRNKLIDNVDVLQELENDIKTNPVIAIQKAISKIDNLQLNNLFGLYQSLNNPEFIENIKNTRNVANILNKIDKNFEAIENDESLDFEEFGEINADGAEEIDTSLNQLLNTFGEITSYDGHVDDMLKYLLNFIPKLNSTSITTNKNGINYDYIKNDYLGTVEFEDANVLMNLLYIEVKKNNVDDFIKDLGRVASNINGAYSLIYLQNLLRAHRDIAYKCMMCFNKPVVEKFETFFDYNGNTSSRVSNESANPTTVIANNIFNSVKLINNDTISYLKDALDYNKHFNAIKNPTYLYQVSKEIFPYITEDSIKRFIEKEDNGANKFINILKSLGNIGYLYNKNILAYNKLTNEQRKNTDIEFITPANQYIINNIAEQLRPYMFVKVNLNSRNPEGNLSSDVINRSYITNFNTIFENEKAIKSYAEQKFAGNGYKYNNILIERYTADGNILPGLFRKVGNEYRITEYGDKLVKVALFNGASDRRNYNSYLYKDMSKGDYFVAGLIEYRNKKNQSININGTVHNFSTSRFFMSIPSDAPKTFAATMPTYSTNGLMTDDAESINYVNSLVDNAISQVNTSVFTVQELENYRSQLFNHYRNEAIKVGRFKRNFNYNHPIVTAFSNIIKQEILDQYEAYSKFFVKDKKGNFTINDKGERVLADIDESTLYNNYEKDKNGNYVKLINGKYVLAGKVGKLSDMHSSYANTTLYDNLVGIDKTIDILYGVGKQSEISVSADGVLNLNNAQEEAINKAVEQFITSYIGNANKLINKNYAAFIKDFTPNEIAEYLLNNFINQVNFDALFNGKTKFYKNEQDILKRLKEIQASGSPFGNTDLSSNSLDGVTESEPITINKETVKVTYFDGTKEVEKIVNMKNKFSAITIFNTIKPSEKEVTKRIKDQLKKANVNNKDIARLLKPFEGNTKVNDAQSYITFEEWIRRITAAGELSKYKQLIKSLTDDTPLSEIYFSKLGKIQVQKNFYYDLYYDPKTKLEVPRQIKNAELVLIPKLIKGTELEKVYNAMMSANIDQLNTVETSKAANHNVLTLWDDKGDITNKNLNNFLEEAPVKSELYSYNFLYRQQEVPSHLKDEQNKIGIQAIKKIIDNITNDPKGVALSNKLFRNLVSNINYSFREVCAELNVSLDDNGNLIINNGIIEGVDNKVLMQLAKENAARQNADKVIMDFLSTDMNGLNKYPVYLSNVSVKVENITNALFNRAITRQKLQGWHAAQVADFGFNIDKHTKRDSALQYRKIGIDKDGNEVHYMEVRLPRWSKQLENVDINDVPDEAKTMIGYRIPTEGKQSMIIIKVVEFLSDAYDSTVVVPDEWVTQTGSDFDVDSIYAMTKQLYTYEENGVKKVNVVDSSKFNLDAEYNSKESKAGYMRYVNSYIDLAARKKLKDYNGIITDTREVLNKETELIREELNNQYLELVQEQIQQSRDAVDGLWSAAKEVKDKDIKKELYEIATTIGNKQRGEKVSDYVNSVIERLTNIRDSNTNSQLAVIDNMLQAFEHVQQQQDAQFDSNVELSQKHTEAVQSMINSVREQQFEQTEKFAKQAQIKSYDMWFSSPVEDRVSNSVRSNEIVNTFIEILNNPIAFEENIGTSNFDDLAKANNEWKQLAGVQDENIVDTNNMSSHDTLTQLDWTESASAGRKLKGISVNMDTFASIGNVTKAMLPAPITVAYNTSDYKIKELKQRFGNNNVEKRGDYIIVKHTTTGWSFDNKNIDGSLITAYSSQTTAHILDVMKEGAIHNENTYTFNAFKIMTLAGLNFETAIGMLYQPAIDILVTKVNESNGFGIEDGVNPMLSAFEEIAKNAGIKYNGGINSIIDNFKKEYGKYIESVYGNFDNPIINNNLNKYRFSKEMNDKDKAIHDFIVLYQFKNLYDMGNLISNTLNVLTADKFGAKQSFFATYNVFKKIEDLLEPEASKLYVYREDGVKETLIESVYPNIRKGMDEYAKSDPLKSTYPSLAAYLKHATLFSVKVIQATNETANPNFVNLVYALRNFTKYGNITEKQFKDYKDYLISRTYVGVDASAMLNFPVSIDTNGEIIINKDSLNNSYAIKQAEIARIAGIGYNTNDVTNFKVTNILKPTTEELNTYINFTPAQKVEWIKRNLGEYIGIFDNINVNSFNENKIRQLGYSGQEISLAQANLSNNAIYDLFDEAYLNKNSFVRLAAIDLVKYSFIVEGFSFKQNNTTRCITTKPLDNYSNNGMDIANTVKSGIRNYRYMDSTGDIYKELAIGYIRTNYDSFEAPYINLDKAYENDDIVKTNVRKVQSNNSKIVIDTNSRKEGIKQTKIIATLNKYGFTKNGEPKPIIRVRSGSQSLLYISTYEDGFIVYHPLNRLDSIDRDKTYENSIIEKNNIYESIPEIISKNQDNELAKFWEYIEANHDIGEEVEITPVLDNTIIAHNFYNENTVFVAKANVPINSIVTASDNNKYFCMEVPNDMNPLRGTYPNYVGTNDRLVCRIVKSNPQYAFSAIEEKDQVAKAVKQSAIQIARESRKGDKVAESITRIFANANINYLDLNSIANNAPLSITSVASYINSAVDKLINKTNEFMQNEYGNVIPIDDEKVIEQAVKDNNISKDFFNTILTISNFKSRFKMFTEIDIEGLDEDSKKAIKTVRDAIAKIDNNTRINNARNAWWNKFYQVTSTNPMLKKEMTDIFTSYGDTSFLDLWVQDAHFNRNAIVQTVIAETESVIKEADIKAKYESKEFINRLNDIKKRALADGKSVRIDKMIKDGRFVQNYSENWNKKYDELNSIYVNAVKETGDENSIKALKAKNNKDRFMANTIISKFKSAAIFDDLTGETTYVPYEKTLARLDYDMLKDYPEIFSEYKKLISQQSIILNNSTDGILNDEQDKKIHEIYRKLRTLTSQFDETLEEKEPKEREASERLRIYINNISALREKFYDRKVKPAFDEQLKAALNVIESLEKRDDNGNLIITKDYLMKNEEYKKAKLWLANNTIYTINKELADKVNAAYELFSDPRKGESVLNAAVKRNDARDEYGVINGTLFTEEEIAKIKEESLKNYNISKHTGQPYAGILRPQLDSNVVYKRSFYQSLKNNKLRADEEVNIIENINVILRKAWNKETFKFDFATKNFTTEDLRKVLGYIRMLDDAKSNSTGGNRSVVEFIENECTVSYNNDAYNNDRFSIKDRSNEFKELWSEVFESTDKDGNVIPERMFYGILKPTNEEKWIDTKKTEALDVITKHVVVTPTEYYNKTIRNNRNNMSKEEFTKWYNDNHIFNPRTQVFEPLRIWTQNEYIGDNGEKAATEYRPRINQTSSEPRKELVNEQWIKGKRNYEVGTGYDNVDYKELNNFEKEYINEVESLLTKYAFTNGNERFVNEGYLPSSRINKKFNLKELSQTALSFLGFSANIPKDLTWKNLDQISYNNDFVLPNPMLQQLGNAETQKRIEVPHFPKQDETNAEFIVRRQEAIDKNKEIDEANAKIHASLVNQDWEKVFNEFIIQSANYNAIQSVKHLYYGAIDALSKHEAYVLNNKGNLVIDRGTSTEDNIEYKTRSQQHTIEQLQNYIRRMVLKQYKDNHSPKLVQLGGFLQNVAGTKYMMMNITGGIANVLTGQANISMERLAREYFNERDFIKGQSLYLSGVVSYMSGMYSEDAVTLQDGIIKLSNIVDYDRLANLENEDGVRENIRKLRGLLFTPQTAGEHYMQNTVLLTMMKTHKVVIDNNGNRVIMSKEAFLRDADENALYEISDDDTRKAYKKMLSDIKKDEAKKAEYNLFRNNLVTDFVRNLPREKQKEYLIVRKEFRNKATEEFNKYNDVYSQFELVDGLARIKGDSELSYKEYARFINKVINVNKTIHGVYDKLGGAMLESSWWGGMLMQFHKHMYPGIKKRYRTRAYYDESLQTIQKGAYTSLYNYLAIPFKDAYKKLANKKEETGEVGALYGIQQYAKSLINFAANFKLNYLLLPENERANIRRSYADVMYAGFAVVGAIALSTLAGGDDDNEESIWYNLLMYHADRLASEAMSFTPIGAVAEGSKLWSSPMAAWQGIDDALKGTALGIKMLVDDGILGKYETGRYAGEEKWKVILERNIPILRSIKRVIDMPDNNSYYKLNDNMLSVVPIKTIAESIRE